MYFQEGRDEGVTVEEWLESVGKLDELIDSKIAERAQIMDLATRMGAEMDGMPHAKGNISDPVGNGAVKLVLLAKEIDKATDEYVDRKQEIIQALETLPEREYGVLHRYYIRYMTLERIAEDMNYSVTHVWRIKQTAIELLEKMGYPKRKA